jgi:protein phosphatase 1L
MTEAFLAADKKILEPKAGLFGMLGERGIGGSKCGSTAAVALVYAVGAGVWAMGGGEEGWHGWM